MMKGKYEFLNKTHAEWMALALWPKTVSRYYVSQLSPCQMSYSSPDLKRSNIGPRGVCSLPNQVIYLFLLYLREYRTDHHSFVRIKTQNTVYMLLPRIIWWQFMQKIQRQTMPNSLPWSTSSQTKHPRSKRSFWHKYLLFRLWRYCQWKEQVLFLSPPYLRA